MTSTSVTQKLPKLGISCEGGQPGFVPIKMNISMWGLPTRSQRWLTIDYRSLSDPSTKSQRSAVLRLSRTNEFYFLKVDRSFHDYRLSITAAIIDATTQKLIYDYSDPLIIDVPSESVEIKRTVGQECKVLFPVERVLSGCRILAALDNGQYRVKRFLNSQTYDVEPHLVKETSKYWYQTIDVSNWQRMDATLLFRGCDDEMECGLVYHSLVTTISTQIEIAVANPRRHKTVIFITHNSGADHVCTSAARLISVAVMAFLFTPKYKWRIDCPDCEANGTRNRLFFRYGPRHGIRNTTNACTGCLGERVFAPNYYCPTMTHAFCNDCVYGTVMKKRYWSAALIPLLEDAIDIDCINCIVSFVVGSATLIKLSSAIDDNNNTFGSDEDRKEGNEGGVMKWGISQVSKWLHSIGLGQYSTVFAIDGIDGPMLINGITAEILESNMSINPMYSHRIMKAIAQLKSQMM